MGLLNKEGGGTGASTEGQTGGDGGGGTPPAATPSSGGTWRDSLPEDIRNDPSIQTFSDHGALAKAFIETKKMVGKKGVILPTEKDGEETWANFHNQIRPSELDKYEVKAPEGASVTPEFMKVFKEMAHKNGLPTKTANNMLGALLSLETGVKKAELEKKQLEEKSGIEALQKEYGKAFDFKVMRANRMIEESKIPGLAEWIEKSGNQNNPMLVKLLVALDDASSEDTVTGAAPGDRLTRTPGEIQAEINEIMSNKNHAKHDAYLNSSHPDHAAAVTYVSNLWKQASQ